ncbi:MAG TPA: hypothetical protein VKB45_00485 [Gemmatimonadales bacterium]|nr:hypothetical protein [Gemmatimonadales bacterium]
MPQSRPPTSVLLVAFLFAAAGQLQSQAERPVCPNRALWPGRLVRVRDTTAASVIGPFVSCDSVLTLGYAPGQIDSGYAVRTALIRRMWARTTQARVGLLAGFATGAVAGGAFAAARTKICFTGSPPVYTRCHDNIVVNAAIVGAAGGLIGWVLGRGFPRWSRIFP